jgi:Histidyl-tRNA synthetase
VVGSYSLLNELDLINIYISVFQQLKIDIELRINNRKILAALADTCGGADKMIDITIAIDKLDKIGIDKVKEELKSRGLNEEQISRIESFLNINGTNEEKLQQLKTLFAENEIGIKGIEELTYLITHSQQPDVKKALVLDLTLARGLNYYTGTIFEVKAQNVQIGSIGGGGRYDDLTGLFGVPNVPGVGISFGVDRIYDVMSELHLFPADVAAGTKVLFFNLGDTEVQKAMELAQQLRAHGIACEVYHENTKFDKQFKYAEKKTIPYVAILGSKELEQGVVNIKNLSSGDQTQVPFGELVHFSFN